MGVLSNASVNRQLAIGVSVFLFSGSRLKLRTPEPSSLRRHPGNPAMEFRAASTDGPMTEAEWEQESRILREAGHGLFKHLLSMYALRKLTAKDFSIAAFWASRAKVPGADWAAYGLPPDSQTGKYQRRLDELLPGAGTLVPVETLCIDRKEPLRNTMHWSAHSTRVCGRRSETTGISWKKSTVQCGHRATRITELCVHVGRGGIHLQCR